VGFTWVYTKTLLDNNSDNSINKLNNFFENVQHKAEHRRVRLNLGMQNFSDLLQGKHFQIGG